MLTFFKTLWKIALYIAKKLFAIWNNRLGAVFTAGICVGGIIGIAIGIALGLLLGLFV